MIIQCPECGHEVSDMAEKCPQCGFPLNQQKANKPKSPKKLFWAFAVTLLIIGLGVVAWFIIKSGEDEPNAIIELTPEFIEKVQKYDRLAPFSEGRATVMRDGLWGYIDTKGDEIIPCQFNSDHQSLVGAELFHEGIAQVYKDGEGYYINRNGKVLFKGLGGRFSEGCALLDDGRIVDTNGKTKFSVNLYGIAYMMGRELETPYTKFPYFENGVLCVYVSDGDDTVEKYYDINGQQVSEPEPCLTVKEYTVFQDNVDYSEFFTGNDKGVKDKMGTVVIPAKYSEIGTPYPGGYASEPNISNGVTLVAIRENDAYYRTEHQIENFSDGVTGEYTPRYYAYADLNGNTTFSNSILSKIKDTERLGKQYWDAEVEEERIRKEIERNIVPEWIVGTWKWSEYIDGLDFTYTVNFNRDSGKYVVNATGGNTKNYSESGTFTYDANKGLITCLPHGGSRAYTYKVDNNSQSILLANGRYLQKSNRSNHYSSYNSSLGKTEFFTASDVIAWLSNKKFYSQGNVLEVCQDGIKFDGNYLSGAPIVADFSKKKAVLRATPIVGGRSITIRLDAANGTIEQQGEIWSLK